MDGAQHRVQLNKLIHFPIFAFFTCNNVPVTNINKISLSWRSKFNLTCSTVIYFFGVTIAVREGRQVHYRPVWQACCWAGAARSRTSIDKHKPPSYSGILDKYWQQCCGAGTFWSEPEPVYRSGSSSRLRLHFTVLYIKYTKLSMIFSSSVPTLIKGYLKNEYL